MMRGVISTRALHPSREQITTRGDARVLSRLTSLAKRNSGKRPIDASLEMGTLSVHLLERFACALKKEEQRLICCVVNLSLEWHDQNLEIQIHLSI
jgi:hypothetical protein